MLSADLGVPDAGLAAALEGLILSGGGAEAREDDIGRNQSGTMIG